MGCCYCGDTKNCPDCGMFDPIRGRPKYSVYVDTVATPLPKGTAKLASDPEGHYAFAPYVPVQTNPELFGPQAVENYMDYRQMRFLRDNETIKERDKIVYQDSTEPVPPSLVGKTVAHMRKGDPFPQSFQVGYRPKEPTTKKNLSTPEPTPIKNDKPAVWDLVIQDMKDRDTTGAQRYGTRLQPFNGRDSLVDAYQEILDLAVYLRQRIFEESATSSRGSKFDKLVLDERARQTEKWGDQTNRSLEEWMLILGEEVGELQKAILEHKFNQAPVADILEELVQVAAVCRSIFEQNPTLAISESKST